MSTVATTRSPTTRPPTSPSTVAPSPATRPPTSPSTVAPSPATPKLRLWQLTAPFGYDTDNFYHGKYPDPPPLDDAAIEELLNKPRKRRTPVPTPRRRLSYGDLTPFKAKRRLSFNSASAKKNDEYIEPMPKKWKPFRPATPFLRRSKRNVPRVNYKLTKTKKN